MAADHYAALGLTRDATPEDIKRAYRKLARQYHPDANRHDPEAEERFKEISHAYDVLSDPQKKERYDLYGDERAGATGFGDFGGISDLFSTFFGGFGSSGGRTGPARGADIAAEVVLTLEEAATGVDRDVEITTLMTCSECDGSGAAAGTSPQRCTECGGTGELRQVRRTVFGDMVTAATCPRCRGAGEIIVSPCPACTGSGRMPVTDTLTVRIPAGIDDGAQLRVTGRGQAGMRGGRSGDLFVVIRVEQHEVFRRAGDDLGVEVAVPMVVAALGGRVTIPTLEDEEEIAIKPGTQSGEVVRLKGRGMPHLGGAGRGEIVCLLRVETPTELTEEQAELLARFADLRGEETGDERGFFDKIKEAFK